MVWPLPSRKPPIVSPQRQSFLRSAWWLFAALGILLALPFVYNFLILDQSNRPFCHKQIESSFRVWMHEHNTPRYPNVQGNSQASLAQIRELLNTDQVAKKYNYVPGLQEGDPGQLVIMYLRVPTRSKWHGQGGPRSNPKQWVLVPCDFVIYDSRIPSGPGELSEWVPFTEFRSRLLATLDFLRTNNRPNWQAAVAEHTKFLESVEQPKR